MTRTDESELLPIYADGGIGKRLMDAMERSLEDYVYSPDEADDHEPTEWERMLMQDFLYGAFNEEVSAILQEDARATLERKPYFSADDLLQSALRDQSIANLSGIDEAMDIMRHVVEWLRKAVEKSDGKPDRIDFRKRIAAAIFDPGATEGLKGDRDLTTWQTDAVMRVLGTWVRSFEMPNSAGSEIRATQRCGMDAGSDDRTSPVAPPSPQLNAGGDRDPLFWVRLGARAFRASARATCGTMYESNMEDAMTSGGLTKRDKERLAAASEQCEEVSKYLADTCEDSALGYASYMGSEKDRALLAEIGVTSDWHYRVHTGELSRKEIYERNRLAPTEGSTDA